MTLLHDAANLITQTNFAGHPFLQRRLRIDFARTEKVLAQLETAGIVGPSNGSIPRDVLVAPDEAGRRVDAFLKAGGKQA